MSPPGFAVQQLDQTIGIKEMMQEWMTKMEEKQSRNMKELKNEIKNLKDVVSEMSSASSRVYSDK